MTEEYKYLLPLLGIFIGWLLNELSHYFRNRGQNKKEIREAAFSLIHLKNQFDIAGMILKAAASGDKSNQVNNLIANSLLKTGGEELDKIKEQVEDSIRLVSSIDPFIALNLRGIANANLHEIVSDHRGDDPLGRELQLKLFNLFSNHLDRTLKKLLWRVDLTLFV